MRNTGTTTKSISKYLPHTTKLTIYQLLLGGKLKCFLGKMFFLVTKYKIVVSIQNSSDIVFIINYEKTSRKDHVKQFRYIYDYVNKALGYETSYYEIKRVINWNIYDLFIIFIKRERFFNKINDQMSQATIKIHDRKLKKIFVFCDTVPLQNYICEIYKKTNVETFSLQHGFYIPDDNKIFELVYKASNAKNFFIWDERTLKYMLKHQGMKKRHFIKNGPISKSLYNDGAIENNKKNDEIKVVAIYGCGKDQIKQNRYLANLYKYLKANTNFDVIFVSHPLFKLLFRIYMSLKHKIYFHPNRKKADQFDLHLVLNSGVWLELEEQGKTYYLLNNDYDNNTPYDQIKSNILSQKVSINTGDLQPFCKDWKSLEIIQKTTMT